MVELFEGLQMKLVEGGWAFGLAAGVAGCFLQPGGDALSRGAKGGTTSQHVVTRGISTTEKKANCEQRV